MDKTSTITLQQQNINEFNNIRKIFFNRSNLIIFFISFIIYFSLNILLINQYHFITSGSLAQTSIALFANISNNPDFGYISTLWPPIDIILRIPLTAFSINIFNTPILAGNILSAIFAAVNLSLLNQIFQILNIKKEVTLILIFLYAVNPITLFFAIDGSSNNLVLSFLLLTFFSLFLWIETLSDRYLGICGILISLTILSNYYLILAPFFLIVFILLSIQRHKLDHAFEKMIFHITPIFYSFVFIFFLNLLVRQDPFSFLSSPYTKLRIMDNIINPVFTVSENFFAITQSQFFIELILAMAIIFPLVIPSFAYFMIKMRTTNRTFAFLPLLAICFIFFDLRVLLGTVAGEYLPILFPMISLSFIMITYLIHKDLLKINKFSYLILVIFLITSNAFSYLSLSNILTDNIASKLIHTIYDDEYYDAFYEEKRISAYLSNNLPAGDDNILINTKNGFPIILFSPDPNKFITDYELNYNEITSDPTKYAKYILIQDPINYGKDDPIHQYYPAMYYNNSSQAKLVVDFGGKTKWKLFKTQE